MNVTPWLFQKMSPLLTLNYNLLQYTLEGIIEIALCIMIKFSGVHVGMVKIIHPKYPDERKTKM